jgi:uncharacterized membrane protein
MRRLGSAVIVIGMVFLLSGIAATAWAASQVSAMTEEDRALNPESYDFYCSAQNCTLGSAVIGLIIITIGVLIGRRTATIAKETKGEEPNEGDSES